MIKTINVLEVEYIAFILAQKMLSFNEPIPDFSTRYPNVLESCLAAPFQTFTGKSLYKNMVEKAAILFYLIVKNHPFQNGNKRIAMMSLLVFLDKNGKWIRTSTQELYQFTMWIAQSHPRYKEETVKAIIKFLNAYVVDANIQ